MYIDCSYALTLSVPLNSCFVLKQPPLPCTYSITITGAVQEGAAPWGLNVLRYEITEVTPDVKIREAMDKQAAAERNRREKVKEV